MFDELERTQESDDVLPHRIRLSQIAHLRMGGISEQNYRNALDSSRVDWQQVHVHVNALCFTERLGLEASKFVTQDGRLEYDLIVSAANASEQKSQRKTSRRLASENEVRALGEQPLGTKIHVPSGPRVTVSLSSDQEATVVDLKSSVSTSCFLPFKSGKEVFDCGCARSASE